MGNGRARALGLCGLLVLAGVASPLAATAAALPAPVAPTVGDDGRAADGVLSSDGASSPAGALSSDDAPPPGELSADATAARSRFVRGQDGTPVRRVSPLTGATAALDGAPVAPQQTTDEAGDPLLVTQRFALTPDRAGRVRVRQTYDPPEQVVSFETTIPDRAVVLDRTGFQAQGNATFEWTDDVSNPTITYALPVNSSVNGTEFRGDGGRLPAMDAGSWALFGRPSTTTSWTRTVDGGPVTQRTRATTAGPGATSEVLVFLGDHDVRTLTANNQRIRMVVPDAAAPVESPADALAALGDASDRLRVGDRDAPVFVVVAPVANGSWGSLRGLATGDADMWVRADQRLDVADNAWFHEYVHTRQSFDTGPRLRWFEEGATSYYAALLALETGRIGFPAFRARLADGARPALDGVVLANRSTWRSSASYDRGALAAARVDRAIRTGTTRNRSLAAVVSVLNAADRVTLAEFLDAVESVGGSDARQTARQVATTDVALSPWNRSQHVRAFGPLPAQPVVSMPEPGTGSVAVSGPARREVVDGTRPVRIATGETVRIDATVRNRGGLVGNYSARLLLNDTVVDRITGTVGPTEPVSAPLSHTFREPGRYHLRVGSQTLSVVVYEPAVPAISDTSVAPRSVQVGEPTSVRVWLRNDAPYPAQRTIQVTRPNATLATRTVHLPPMVSTSVTIPVAFQQPGDVVVGVTGGSPTLVSVDPLPLDETAVATPTDATPTDATPTATPTPSPTATATARPTTTDGSAPGPGSDTPALPAGGAGSTLAVVALATLLGVLAAYATLGDRS